VPDLLLPQLALALGLAWLTGLALLLAAAVLL
jgi:hypothetical protein